MNKFVLGWVLFAVGMMGLILGLVFLFAGKPSNDIKGDNTYKAWLPILISTVSFFVSAYTLWSTKLAPFNLSVIPTGRVVLTSNPSSPGAKQPAISLQLLFSNSGAKHGYVDDVACILLKKDAHSKPLLFRSLYEHLEDTLNLTNQLPPPKLLAFTSFPVRPDDNIAKKIVFVPFESGLDLNFTKGKYSIVPYTLEINPSREWKAWNNIEVDINEEDLRLLSQTTATQTAGGGQFIKWVMHSKPSSQQEEALRKLNEKLAEIEKK